MPKRQVEQLVVRAAQDFNAFYAQRSRPANDTLSAHALLVMTSDGKGITVIPKALRPATRTKAAAAKAVKPAHSDPMAPKKLRKHSKRMALVTAVYEIEPHLRTAHEIVAGLSRVPAATTAKMVPRPQHKTVVATIVKSQTQGIRAMFEEAERRDPTHTHRPVVLVDGAQQQLEKIECEAKRRTWPVTIILDLLHVLHYVWAAVKALYAKAKRKLQSVLEESLWMLLRGRSNQLARTIETLAAERGMTKARRKPVDKCVAYLRRHAKYLCYDRYLAAGYPIATGVIEGACRYLVQDRMGITGARWDLPSAEAVLRLRALWTNGDWEAYWRFHEKQHALRSRLKLAS